MKMREVTERSDATVDTTVGEISSPRTSVDRLDVRTHGSHVNAALDTWIHERASRQLGKFATQIEHLTVRFSDENGPRGGVDQRCAIHVTLHALPEVIISGSAETPREAFDGAIARVERAVRRTLDKHGFAARRSPRAKGGPDAMSASPEPDDRRIDTAKPGVSASDRKIGNGLTASRNIKVNTAGMTQALEDAETGRPSRKSTRRGMHGEKPDASLTLRTKTAMHTPQARAARVKAKPY